MFIKIKLIDGDIYTLNVERIKGYCDYTVGTRIDLDNGEYLMCEAPESFLDEALRNDNVQVMDYVPKTEE